MWWLKSRIIAELIGDYKLSDTQRLLELCSRKELKILSVMVKGCTLLFIAVKYNQLETYVFPGRLWCRSDRHWSQYRNGVPLSFNGCLSQQYLHHEMPLGPRCRHRGLRLFINHATSDIMLARL